MTNHHVLLVTLPPKHSPAFVPDQNDLPPSDDDDDDAASRNPYARIFPRTKRR